jgi:hypothetical protein
MLLLSECISTVIMLLWILISWLDHYCSKSLQLVQLASVPSLTTLHDISVSVSLSILLPETSKRRVDNLI